MARFRLGGLGLWLACFVVCFAGCQTIKPIPVALPLPPRPALTPVTASQVQCLAPDAYTTLVNRERALRTWGLQLEAIIRANNAKAGK